MKQILLVFLTVFLYILDSARAYAATETLCGGELVDTLQFVCGDRGFYFERNNGRSNHRSDWGIVERCCFKSCNLELLERYCAKPAKNERDVSTAPATALPPLYKQDLYHKHHHAKGSKYDIWQRKSVQRLRRGVPAIVRARQYRLLMQQVEESDQALSHRPFTTLPVTQPLHLQHDSEPSQN
ncbi:hypothetical protein GDO86_008730 [Hymenochirus boettgeri]|uniref:Insulin-like domain-containing protein n=1 Tax=Hymenochirus boettgeri TaxID=247094 RepID=A0A8T2IYN8_9PIPI|nr:hypothetical protein GDO86_008730 [Hymenochirus boettgeri]